MHINEDYLDFNEYVEARFERLPVHTLGHQLLCSYCSSPLAQRANVVTHGGLATAYCRWTQLCFGFFDLVGNYYEHWRPTQLLITGIALIALLCFPSHLVVVGGFAYFN